MSKEEADFLEHLRKKSIESAAEIMESLQRLKVLYDEITDDGSGTAMPKPRPGDFFYRLARYELEHAANVIRLGNSQAEMVFDHVRQLSRRTRGAAGQSTTQVVLLEPQPTHAPKEFVGRFEIKNPFDADADPRFEIDELRDQQGVVATTTDDRTKLTKPKYSVSVECKGPVSARRTAYVTVKLVAKEVEDTLFGELIVYLSADTERQVARRAIKVRKYPKDAGAK